MFLYCVAPPNLIKVDIHRAVGNSHSSLDLCGFYIFVKSVEVHRNSIRIQRLRLAEKPTAYIYEGGAPPTEKKTTPMTLGDVTAVA